MLYSPEAKRKIILDNYNNPKNQLKLDELQKQSAKWQSPLASFHSLDKGCGDVLYLLIIKKDNFIEKCLFSAQQSCLITIAIANILCSCLEEQGIGFARKILNNCQKMIEGEEYKLDGCPDLQVFSDISNFPHRVECAKIVIRGVASMLKK